MSIAAVDRPPALAVPGGAAPSGLATLVPAARPGESPRLVRARRAASRAGRPSSPTAALLVRHGAPRSRAWLTAAWGGAATDRALVVDEGCDVHAGSVALDERTRHALLRWLPPERRELVVLEAGLFREEPWAAFVLLLRPPLLWTLDEAVAARGAAPPGSDFDVESFERIEREAREMVGLRQLLRLQATVLRIEHATRMCGLPGACATLAAGCAALATDRERGVGIVATQLARYAFSRRVATLLGA